MIANQPLIKTALLSVSNKTGLIELAEFLQSQGIRLLSTGGTAKLLQDHNIPVIQVSDYTGFPEIMDGRIKTLHPKIHGGLLARPGLDDQIRSAYHIENIDLLVINLYPFIQDPSIENIDIGGPAMLRAAAKNHSRVTVLSDPNDYKEFMQALIIQKGGTTLEARLVYAQKTFAHTAFYDSCIAEYMAQQVAKKPAAKKEDYFPDTYQISYQKKQDLPYGENPQQKAAFYIKNSSEIGCIATAKQLQGKPLSYNNIVDADAALECLKQLPLSENFAFACVIVKHANPCGVALADSQSSAYQRAFTTDPSSAYGGIIAFNTLLEHEAAAKIIAQQFVEVIIAPDISPEALKVLKSKPNIRILKTGHWVPLLRPPISIKAPPPPAFHCKQVSNGLLVQEQDYDYLDINTLVSQTPRSPTLAEQLDLALAWKLVKFVKSNAIVFVKNQMAIGIGAGQMSRIDSTKIALRKAMEAGLSTQGAVMASDAFFPFPDNVEIAAEAGITAIIQPGGSMRDPEVINAAKVANISLLFTGLRHFWH